MFDSFTITKLRIMTELEVDLLRDTIHSDVCQEFHYIDDLPISDDEKNEIISDITHYITNKIEQTFMTYKKYITPIEAHNDVMREAARMKRLNVVANELYPLPNGELRTDFKGLTTEQRNKVYASNL